VPHEMKFIYCYWNHLCFQRLVPQFCRATLTVSPRIYSRPSERSCWTATHRWHHSSRSGTPTGAALHQAAPPDREITHLGYSDAVESLPSECLEQARPESERRSGSERAPNAPAPHRTRRRMQAPAVGRSHHRSRIMITQANSSPARRKHRRKRQTTTARTTRHGRHAVGKAATKGHHSRAVLRTSTSA